MKINIKPLMIFFICLIIGSSVLGGTARCKEQRPAISSDERALAMWEVQFVMSKHAYYKQINQHCEEMADIWVKKDGPSDETATWTSQFGVEVGYDQIKLNYCTTNLEDLKKKLEEASKKNPEIKNIPENIGIGGGYGMHTNLTPVIEISGDGKTAKGVWYSLGVNGNDMAVPEKYAADFVKEDGKWKIWHFVNLFEPVALRGTEEYPHVDNFYKKPLGAKGVLPGEKPTTEGGIHYITRTAPDLYNYDPKVVPKIYPKLPEPYYTFGETFSY
jgi:hypothetical protein